jgi:hypothetical protein
MGRRNSQICLSKETSRWTDCDVNFLFFFFCRRGRDGFVPRVLGRPSGTFQKRKVDQNGGATDAVLLDMK